MCVLLIKTEPTRPSNDDEILHCGRKIRSGQKHAYALTRS